MTRILVALFLAGVPAGGSVLACTVFYAAQGDVVLAGNNEDFFYPDTKMWFIPPEDGKYGRVYFGFDDVIAQGGMNDQGLFFDGLMVPRMEVKASEQKERYLGRLPDKALSECATVEQVVRLFERYGRQSMERAQYMFGDATGDSVIIEGNAIVRKQGRYQVVTNFRQSTAKPGAIRCERYKIAVEMLEKSQGISVDLFRRILAATHQEGHAPTLYSNVYDLKNRVVYVYHFHNFENVVRIDLADELKKGRHGCSLPSLFPKTFAATVYARQAPEYAKAYRRRLAEEKHRRMRHATSE